MVVSVTASTTSGQPLSEESLKKVLGACEAALQLDQDKVRGLTACLHICKPLSLKKTGTLCPGRHSVSEAFFLTQDSGAGVLEQRRGTRTVCRLQSVQLASSMGNLMAALMGLTCGQHARC